MELHQYTSIQLVSYWFWWKEIATYKAYLFFDRVPPLKMQIFFFHGSPNPAHGPGSLFSSLGLWHCSLSSSPLLCPAWTQSLQVWHTWGLCPAQPCPVAIPMGISGAWGWDSLQLLCSSPAVLVLPEIGKYLGERFGKILMSPCCLPGVLQRTL